jgi:hypothetical protein
MTVHALREAAATEPPTTDAETPPTAEAAPPTDPLREQLKAAINTWHAVNVRGTALLEVIARSEQGVVDADNLVEAREEAVGKAREHDAIALANSQVKTSNRLHGRLATNCLKRRMPPKSRVPL